MFGQLTTKNTFFLERFLPVSLICSLGGPLSHGSPAGCVSCGSWASMLLRKWREMEKAVGEGESCSRTRAANGNI